LVGKAGRNSSTLSFAKHDVNQNFMSSSFAYHSRPSNGLLKTNSFENGEEKRSELSLMIENSDLESKERNSVLPKNQPSHY